MWRRLEELAALEGLSAGDSCAASSVVRCRFTVSVSSKKSAQAFLPFQKNHGQKSKKKVTYRKNLDHIFYNLPVLDEIPFHLVR